MKHLVKAIVTGFGLSVGAYVFRKISERYNLDPAATTPGTQQQSAPVSPTV
jgi:hypothetical protein